VSADFPLLAEAEAFRPVGAAGRPIFRWDRPEYAMFYAPGCLCVAGLPDAVQFEATILAQDCPRQVGDSGGANLPGLFSEGQQGREVTWEAKLWQRADQASAEARRWQEEPFSPECLTLYMNNECNLGCVYCHTDPLPAPAPRLGLPAIAAAADVVAGNCQRKGRPLYGVFHGGGEPTLDRRQVEQALVLLEKAATAHGVGLFRYVATNGVMAEEKAAWLARHFDLVGLSCDGPPEIQDHQRPRINGRATAHIVERTAHILQAEGCRYHVRTTITTTTLRRQAKIADYICQQFAPEEIHFEPVYLGGRTTPATGLAAHQAGEFVAHFLQARAIAGQHGILLMTSGSRPDAIHGPYCHVFRHTLNLVPGDVATACFKVTDGPRVEAKGVTIGALNREAGCFEIDHPRVQALRQQLDVAPAYCAGCFNRYHCVRECPDRCPLDAAPHPNPLPVGAREHTPLSLGGRGGRPQVGRGEGEAPPSFRCLMQKALAYAILRQTADRLWAADKSVGVARGTVYGTTSLRSVLPLGPTNN
jgi:uncharacterized protein